MSDKYRPRQWCYARHVALGWPASHVRVATNEREMKRKGGAGGRFESLSLDVYLGLCVYTISVLS